MRELNPSVLENIQNFDGLTLKKQSKAVNQVLQWLHSLSQQERQFALQDPRLQDFLSDIRVALNRLFPQTELAKGSREAALAARLRPYAKQQLKKLREQMPEQQRLGQLALIEQVSLYETERDRFVAPFLVALTVGTAIGFYSKTVASVMISETVKTLTLGRKDVQIPAAEVIAIASGLGALLMYTQVYAAFSRLTINAVEPRTNGNHRGKSITFGLVVLFDLMTSLANSASVANSWTDESYRVWPRPSEFKLPGVAIPSAALHALFLFFFYDPLNLARTIEDVWKNGRSAEVFACPFEFEQWQIAFALKTTLVASYWKSMVFFAVPITTAQFAQMLFNKNQLLLTAKQLGCIESSEEASVVINALAYIWALSGGLVMLTFAANKVRTISATWVLWRHPDAKRARQTYLAAFSQTPEARQRKSDESILNSEFMKFVSRFAMVIGCLGLSAVLMPQIDRVVEITRQMSEYPRVTVGTSLALITAVAYHQIRGYRQSNSARQALIGALLTLVSIVLAVSLMRDEEAAAANILATVYAIFAARLILLGAILYLGVSFVNAPDYLANSKAALEGRITELAAFEEQDPLAAEVRQQSWSLWARQGISGYTGRVSSALTRFGSFQTSLHQPFVDEVDLERAVHSDTHGAINRDERQVFSL